MNPFDIIPDTHGQSAKLDAALAGLGWRRSALGWTHPDPDRQIVFLGDFIDRGCSVTHCFAVTSMDGRIVSVAVTIAVGVNMDGRREVLGMAIGASEAEPFWTDFLRDLVRRGLSGVKLVISDAHEGIKAATARVLSTTWQRCRVHFQRNALAHAGKSSRRVVSAFIATAFAQPDHATAKAQ